MTDKRNLKEISRHYIFLKKNQVSEEIVLKDDVGEGDMYFTFCLKYAEANKDGLTHLNIIDKFHAAITIEVRPQARTTSSAPILLGTYADNKDLYVDFVVAPKSLGGYHNIMVIFYRSK